MAVLTADFETGTSGNTIATTDAGSQTAWDTVSIAAGDTLTYDNASPAHGSLCAKGVMDASASQTWLSWTTSNTDFYGRFYFQFSADPSANAVMLEALNGTSQCASIRITSVGKLQITPSSGTGTTGTTTYSTGTWYRCEFHITHDTAAGVVAANTYTGDGTTTLDSLSLTSQNTLASSTSQRFGPACGLNNIASYTLLLDNIVSNCTAYPGAYPVFSACTVSGSTPSGSTLTVTPTLNGTFTLGYQWTSNGSNIVGATSSTYVTQAGDVGNAIGCTVTATGQQASNESAAQASSNTITVTSGGSGLFSKDTAALPSWFVFNLLNTEGG